MTDEHDFEGLIDAFNEGLEGKSWTGPGRYEWTPYDADGKQYVIDDTATGLAYLLTLEAYREASDE